MALVAGSDGESESEAIAVGSRKQLFIDDRFVRQQEGITFRAHPPARAEPVILPTTPVESHCVGGYVQVIEAEGGWRMYYGAIPSGDFSYDSSRKDGSGYMVCLATSADGLDWQREEIDLYDIQGSTRNNVVIPNAYGTLLVDSHQTDGCRYWFLAHMEDCAAWNEADGLAYHSGLYLLRSADGIHFVREPGQALPFYMDSWNQCFFDPRIDRYVAYLRSWVPDRDRSVSRQEFDALLPLPWPHNAFDPERQRPMANTLIDEVPVVMQRGPEDPPSMDLYTSCVHLYEAADEVYVAFPSRYRHYDGLNAYGRDARDEYENNGVIDVALAVSRNGVDWHRFPQAYLGLGRLGQVDSGTLYMGLGMVITGDEIWQYCAVQPDRASYFRGDERTGAIIRLVQRLDGFVSADAGPAGGELTTPPLVFEGNRLELNIDCGAMGEAWVEILDDHGMPLPGFTLDDCVSVDRNGVAQEVWWKGGPDVAALAGRPIQLRIRMRSAKLYAFQFL
jgi:hypothetical protein